MSHVKQAGQKPGLAEQGSPGALAENGSLCLGNKSRVCGRTTEMLFSSAGIKFVWLKFNWSGSLPVVWWITKKLFKVC